MTFRDGLLRARGQIVFILALGLSIGVILWLESLETAHDGDVQTIGSNRPGVRADGIASQNVLDGVRRAELALQEKPDSIEAIAALATALSAASISAAMDQPSARERIRPLLPALQAADTPLASSTLSLAAVAFPELSQFNPRAAE